MSYKQKYLEQALIPGIFKNEFSGSVAWQCPSNIALIKYWGKQPNQIPMNASLSMTLEKAVTKTEIAYNYSESREKINIDYYFHGQRKKVFEKRLLDYFKDLTEYFPFLDKLELFIRSDNSFPHSTGIASSASAFGAIALCLTEIEYHLKGESVGTAEFYNKASFIARLGSGSASRSIFGGLVEWGRHESVKGSTDETAIQVSKIIHPYFKNFQDFILILDKGKKDISSADGHNLMNSNPYASTRFQQAHSNLNELIHAIQRGNMEKFINIVEAEAMNLHAMMMTSSPGYMLMKPGTVEVIEKIKRFRTKSEMPVCYTLDAGANVHFLGPQSCKPVMVDFVENELKSCCFDGDYIQDRMGNGPEKIKDE
ncbi:MAG: hypothetical protein JW894_08025 [Bacteroidales bacterium]|nr:hypothetical protein [Bacteroidales bacterium]